MFATVPNSFRVLLFRSRRLNLSGTNDLYIKFTLGNQDVTVCFEILKLLDLSAGPANTQSLDCVGISQPKMEHARLLRSEAADRKQVTNNRASLDLDGHFGPNSGPIAGGPVEGDAQIMLLGKTILEQPQRCATHLPDKQV